MKSIFDYLQFDLDETFMAATFDIEPNLQKNKSCVNYHDQK